MRVFEQGNTHLLQQTKVDPSLKFVSAVASSIFRQLAKDLGQWSGQSALACMQC